MRNKLIIRNATIDDVPFVGWTIAEALGDDDPSHTKGFIDAAKREDTIYSWKFARIAQINKEVVGCQVACTGAEYINMRKQSWMIIWKNLTESYIDTVPLESEADEYHLDSIAILPQYRGLHISTELIMDSVNIGQKLGYKRTSFVVDASHNALHEYYKSIGFKDEKTIRLGYTDFIKMVKDC